MAVLVLLCKRPAPGVGKQRLAVDCGEEAAYKISQYLLSCAIEDLSQWKKKQQGVVVISPAKAGDSDWAKTLLSGAKIIPQINGNLGQRINALDKKLRDLGHQSIIYIGSDCPMLTNEDYRHADFLLQDNDTVFMPAKDGGVVLMASRLPWPNLGSLPWSSNTLGDALKKTCSDNGHIVSQFEIKIDLDNRNDALEIMSHLTADHRKSRKELVCCIRNIITPKLSVIIPCFHDEVYLQKLLININSQNQPPHEIIVIDAAQSQRCKKICAEWGNRFSVTWIPSSPCRGKQLREGAQAASGDVLWFLHADAIIDSKAAHQVIQCIQQGKIAGYFQFHFDHQSIKNDKNHIAVLIAKSIEKLTQWRNRWGGIYGDQGIFVTRSAYFACGGHSEAPLFEEVPLIKALRKIKMSGKQKPLTEIPTGLRINPRRWQKDGWIYRSFRNRLFALLHMMGVPETILAKHYSLFHLGKNSHA